MNGFAGRFATALVMAVGASLLLGDFRAGQLSLFLSLAVLAVSLDLVWGYAGILSLGQLLPFGAGAYFTARLTSEAAALSPVALLCSAALGAAVAAAVGIAAFRRQLSLVVIGLLTLMLSLTFERVAAQWRAVTGGFNGLTDVPQMNLFGWQLGDRAQDLAITVSSVAIIAAVWWLVHRPIGAVLVGIRDNERRMEALGYDTIRLKVWVYALGGVVAGLGGALYVHRTGFVAPGVFGFTLATNVVLWTLIGGRGTVIGPVIGTFAINFASAALADAWLQYWVLATGLVFIAAVVLIPEGVLPWALGRLGRPARSPNDPTLSVLQAPSPSSALDAVLSAQSIGKAYGPFTVLDDVSISIQDPELHCLIGPNGAGKTTMLDILCGQQAHQRGTVAVFGDDLTTQPAWRFARRGVSRKFQAPHVLDSLSVAENLAVAGWGRAASPWTLVRSGWQAELGEGALQILDRTGLGERRHEVARSLSHGEKQWLEIAMALAGTCRLLLLDEPTAGMTAAESLEAAALLRGVHAELNLPIVIVEHDMAFIRAVADRVTVLARGGIIADGPVVEVENDPAVRSVYLGIDP